MNAPDQTKDSLAIAGYPVDSGSTQLLPYIFCVNNNVVILGKVDPAGLDPIVVGMENPEDIQTLEIIARKFRDRGIRAVQISASDVTRALSVGFRQAKRIRPEKEPVSDDLYGSRYSLEIGEAGSTRVTGLEAASSETFDEGAIIELVDKVLIDAVKRGATDIHIENFIDRINLRYKIDGLLYSVNSPINKTNAEQVISRLKVMSNLDIAEKRLPQDGRVVLLAMRGNREVQLPFRLSILPGPYGEDVVLRILDKSMAPIDLERLGFASGDLDTFKSLIHSPQGLLLVTGPTGSGKTTTLYASLKEINTPQKKILSAEDPIEYALESVCQKQVSKHFGFADLARAFLRHDPDILLIGEIRDEDTADIAIKAAQTGHLILSTLHTNDSFGAVGRLAGLGVPSNLIASSLIGVLSQRLVRRVCRYCRTTYDPDPAHIEVIGPYMGKKDYIRGEGCDKCYNTGYMGRIGIFEMLAVNDELQWMIQTESPEPDLRREAVKSGMRLLVVDALSKVREDITTAEEIFRVLPYRQIVSQLALMEKSPTPTN